MFRFRPDLLRVELRGDATLAQVLTAQFSDGTLEHLRIKVEPERLHVSRLLATQKVARST